MLSFSLKRLNVKISIAALPQRFVSVRLRRMRNPRTCRPTKVSLNVYRQFKSEESDWSFPAVRSCRVVFLCSPYIYTAV